ncbi:hypothetical protein BDZ45DRAFT_425378 [Acephala macrosclerotiorum]|nr:hypothetical protein BDZ45DRAFT_425378 [Acephala macrosclerotiorum]
MPSTIIRILWPRSIYLRLYRVLIICGAVVSLLRSAHTKGMIDLGYFYTIIQRRDEILMAIFNATYKPVSPVLVPIIWGGSMNMAMDPNLPFPSPVKFVGIAFGAAGIWVWTGCFPTDGKDIVGPFTCTRDCGEAFFSSVLMFGLMFATWMRWQWDAGFWDWTLQWGFNNETGALEKMPVPEATDIKNLNGSSDDHS